MAVVLAETEAELTHSRLVDLILAVSHLLLPTVPLSAKVHVLPRPEVRQPYQIRIFFRTRVPTAALLVPLFDSLLPTVRPTISSHPALALDDRSPAVLAELVHSERSQPTLPVKR